MANLGIYTDNINKKIYYNNQIIADSPIQLVKNNIYSKGLPVTQVQSNKGIGIRNFQKTVYINEKPLPLPQIEYKSENNDIVYISIDDYNKLKNSPDFNRTIPYYIVRNESLDELPKGKISWIGNDQVLTVNGQQFKTGIHKFSKVLPSSDEQILKCSENGDFDIRLQEPPLEDQTVIITPDEGIELSTSNTLIFTKDNWYVPQHVIYKVIRNDLSQKQTNYITITSELETQQVKIVSPKISYLFFKDGVLNEDLIRLNKNSSKPDEPGWTIVNNELYCSLNSSTIESIPLTLDRNKYICLYAVLTKGDIDHDNWGFWIRFYNPDASKALFENTASKRTIELCKDDYGYTVLVAVGGNPRVISDGFVKINSNFGKCSIKELGIAEI